MMKKLIVMVFMVCLVVTSLVGCSLNDGKKADLVVLGTIYTAEDDNNSQAEAFAVKDGKYIYVGDKEGVQNFIKEGKTEVIDRTGEGLIIPGCTEGHSHYFGAYGVGLQLPGYNCSYKEMLKILKEQAESDNIKQFVSCGWNSFELASEVMAGENFADEIEKIAPGIPVVLLDNSGHHAVCNNTALKKAGLFENPEVRGGEINLDKDGRPSGYVSDQVVGYVLEKAIESPLTDEEYRQACLTAMQTLLKEGYTNALDAYINHYDESALSKILKQMDDSGELTINVASCYNIKSYDADEYKEKVDYVDELNQKYKTKHYNPGYIKLFADGVVEGGTGWMLTPYKNSEKGKGNIIWTPDELNALVEYANSKNILVHTHSYGDAACKNVLDVYIASNKANGREYRNCLGHVRNIKFEDILRAAEHKIPIAENLIWHTDYDESDPEQLFEKQYILNYVPEDIYYSGYPMKSLIENGVIMSSSTDAPAAEFVEGNIMNVLEIATTGITPNDNSKPFGENELLTVREGLQALTINGAWQLGLEDERGSIKVGKYADFVILDKNILDYEGEELRTIHDTKIMNTYFEGKNVYTAQ